MPDIFMTDWPWYSPDDLNRRECTLNAVKLMANASQTAPNAGGVTQVESHIVWGQKEQEQVARKMEELAWEVDTGRMGRLFKTEAVMVRESDAILFLGDFRAHETPMDGDCGFCGGVDNCSHFYDRRPHIDGQVDTTRRKFDTLVNGPLCGIRVHDFGYAIGSALWMANRLLVDARAYMTVGVAGQRLEYCPNSGIVVGILVAALSKNPYVDVNPDYHITNISKIIDNTRRLYSLNRQSGSDYRFRDPGWEAERDRLKKENDEGKEEK
jgi:uncharacterized ferredoxin-like protein